MPEERSGRNQFPDLATIHRLIRLMQRYDLTAIDLGEGPTKVRLRRRGHAAVAATATLPAPAALSPNAPVALEPYSQPPAPQTPAGTVIESPMVGTFYASSSPEAPPFVTVGTAVRAETIVCIIEAMKVFTDIPAGVAGTITEVLVKNGQPVEFGQPLFRVSQE